MLKAVALILGSGFEAALILAIMIIWLRRTAKMYLSRWLACGAAAALLTGWLVLYVMVLSGPKKERFTGWAMAAGLITELVCYVWLLRRLRRGSASSEASGPLFSRKTLEIAIVFLTSGTLTLLPFMKILQFPSNIFIQTYSVVNTELILKFAGGVLGGVLCFLFALAFLKNTRTLSVGSIAIGSTALIIVLMANQLSTIVQILFARGVFPLTPRAMKILVPLINNMDKYIYALIAVSLVWTLLAVASFLRRRERLSTDWNSAVQRKFKAGERSRKRWAAAIVSLLIMLPGLIGLDAYLAGRTVELSAAEPVAPDHNHNIVIPRASVDDRNLHRFGYTAADGTMVRFIIIRKSETTYGVGFDACKICGSTGYYQKNGKVICRKCDVIMNIPTIGFEGGCNPIPLPYQMNEGNLVIASADLEKETATFHQESLFE